MLQVANAGVRHPDGIRGGLIVLDGLCIGGLISRSGGRIHACPLAVFAGESMCKINS